MCGILADMTPWLSRTWVGVLALILWVVCLVACRSSTEAPSLPAPPTADAPDEWVNDLRPISSADWGYQRAAHLLERAGFGGTPQEIWELAQLPPNVAVKRLVRYQRIDNIDFEPFPASGIFPSDDFAPASIGSVVRSKISSALWRRGICSNDGSETKRPGRPGERS